MFKIECTTAQTQAGESEPTCTSAPHRESGIKLVAPVKVLLNKGTESSFGLVRVADGLLVLRMEGLLRLLSVVYKAKTKG